MKNLNPCQTGFYHRDTQDKSLKIIIYLTDVNNENGPLKIIYPEISQKNNSLICYKDCLNIRTTEEQILQVYPKENILSIEEPKFTMIIFDGNIIHSGGYIKKGSRIVLYIEVT
jgi:hypothetical protein